MISSLGEKFSNLCVHSWQQPCISNFLPGSAAGPSSSESKNQTHPQHQTNSSSWFFTSAKGTTVVQVMQFWHLNYLWLFLPQKMAWQTGQVSSVVSSDYSLLCPLTSPFQVLLPSLPEQLQWPLGWSSFSSFLLSWINSAYHPKFNLPKHRSGNISGCYSGYSVVTQKPSVAHETQEALKHGSRLFFWRQRRGRRRWFFPSFATSYALTFSQFVRITLTGGAWVA